MVVMMVVMVVMRLRKSSGRTRDHQREQQKLFHRESVAMCGLVAMWKLRLDRAVCLETNLCPSVYLERG
jgi:hypothetical protein